MLTLFHCAFSRVCCAVGAFCCAVECTRHESVTGAQCCALATLCGALTCAALLTCCHWTLVKVSAHALQEAREHAEYHGSHLRADALSEHLSLSHAFASRFSGHRLIVPTVVHACTFRDSIPSVMLFPEDNIVLQGCVLCPRHHHFIRQAETCHIK